jgi:sentrin-specific protease 1
LTDDEDEAPTQPSKTKLPLMDRLVSKFRQAMDRIPPTPLYDRLRKKRETEARAWIGRQERSRLREKGFFVPESNALPVLSPDAVQTVQEIWTARDDGGTVAEAGDIPLTLSDLRRFKGKTWLNDECINGYLQLVQARNPADVHSFSTFFYSTLCKNGYSGVQRWSRRFDLFSKKLILIPVHLGMHWTMSCIDLEHRLIMYMDSFHAENNRCLDTLWSYMESEHRDKKGRPWDSSRWTAKSLSEGVPRQLNGYDCGVFTCVFGEHLARRAPFDFTQADMPYFRHRLTYELVTGALLS